MAKTAKKTKKSSAKSRKGLKPLVLVDGSSYLYRAFHAMPALMNSSGEPTGAIYGVVNMLRRLLTDIEPEYIAVVFDAPGKTFRDDMYKEYKANRPPMPDELRSQIETLHQVVRAMGLPLIMHSRVEADDVIGTLATEATQAGQDMPVLISTGDKDMAQLVDDKVSLINTMTGVLMDPAGVIDKFGVRPDQIIDYLALIGDSVDNVPGVPKVGPKTAVKWLEAHDTLDEIMTHADEIKGKVGESLRDSLGQLPLSRQLVTIKCDVDMDTAVKDLRRCAPDTAELKTLFQQLEFKSWLSALLDHDSARDADSSDKGASDNMQPIDETVPATAADYDTVYKKSELGRWLKKLAGAKLFAFDLETTSLAYMDAEIVGMSFSIEPGEAAYVPVAHQYVGAPQQLDRQYVLQQLKPLLEDESQQKLGQHMKYDMNVLANYDIALRGVRHDSMLESYVLDSTATRHDMDSLALKYLGHKTIHYEDVAGKGKKQCRFDEVPIEQAAPYAAEDADITLRLHETLWDKLARDKKLKHVYDDIEIPLLPVLSRIERNGVMVDAKMLARQSKELSRRINEIQAEAFEEAGESFNIGSPKQIQAILFGKLGLPVRAKTPKGQPSTAEAVLQELASNYALPKLILEFRSMSKLKSTYTDKLPLQINSRTGRVHTSYHQAVAATGRLSSSDPNLQNIPIRTPEGRRIRQAFVAAEGYRILAADYSQIELRIMAHLSEDEGLLSAFAAGDDIHRATAAEVFAVDPGQVSDSQRRSAKAINFGLIYGMSAFGLAKQLGTERRQAQEYIDLYFRRYPGVKDFMDSTRELARQQLYVETVFGRRLHVPDINASNAQRRQYAERTAINAPMQGTAADIIKMAMIQVDQWLSKAGLDARMIMQVHDELVFEVAEAGLDELRQNVCALMEAAAQLRVPLLVDAGVGSNWDEAH